MFDKPILIPIGPDTIRIDMHFNGMHANLQTLVPTNSADGVYTPAESTTILLTKSNIDPVIEALQTLKTQLK